MKYNDKNIFECDISEGNSCRKDYLDSINRFIEKKYNESFENRNKFMADITENQEVYRKQYIDMIGQPVSPYPENIPAGKMKHIGKDDFGDVYKVQIEVMPDFWFYGMLMVPFGAKKVPLVIAQHGGTGTPEKCSDFIGKNNYGNFTKKALEKKMAVFAPQLLLWTFENENLGEKPDIDIPYNRREIDNKLKQIGISITGIEVFCIRRSIDYLHSLEFIDENRTGMMGLSYGGYFSIHTAAADKRIKSIYAGAFFNDRTKIAFEDWTYKNSANIFCDAEVVALCAPRRLQVDVGKSDKVFDFMPSVEESKRAEEYYKKFGATDKFRYNLWDGGHFFDESRKGFEFFFEGIWEEL